MIVMTVKVRCEITILEIDGRVVDTNTKDKPVLVMESEVHTHMRTP